MGKKNRSKNVTIVNNPAAKNGDNKQKVLKLSLQKRNELNKLVEKLKKTCCSILQTSSSSSVNKEWDVYLEVEKILTKIINIEKDLKVPLPSRNDASLETFMSWFKENGGQAKGIDVAQFDGLDLGVLAKEDITEGELLISVPRKLMMTSDNVETSLLGPLYIMDPMIRHMNNIAISLFLLVERFRTDTDSFWAPYLNVLPSTYNTVMYFTTAQLQELKGCPVFELALKQYRNIARQYAYFYQLFQSVSDSGSNTLRDIFTYEQYRWAVSTVMTRQNFIPRSQVVGSVDMANALIPMWDFCNHENGKLSTDFKVELDECICLAHRDFKAGEQVCLYYGARSNAELLIHNGFVYEDNETDWIKIKLGISKSDPLQPLRSKLLSKLNIGSLAEFSLFKGPEPIEDDMLAFLRVFSMGEELLNQWLEREKEQCADLKCMDCAMDTQVEIKMWNFLMARIKLLLASYPTTLEDDTKLIESEKSTMDIRRQLPIRLRISEKKILRSALEYVEQRSKI